MEIIIQQADLTITQYPNPKTLIKHIHIFPESELFSRKKDKFLDIPHETFSKKAQEDILKLLKQSLKDEDAKIRIGDQYTMVVETKSMLGFNDVCFNLAARIADANPFAGAH